MFFNGGKEVCTRLTGYINYPEFRDAIENIIDNSCSLRERTTVRCDVLIIGAGPAGLTSAIYTSRSRLQTVVIDQNLAGGQVATTFHISNYPGTNGEVRGIDLMENMKKQAIDFGAQIDEMQRILEINFTSNEKYIKTEHNDYYSKSVIIATGAEPRKLPVPEERDYRGRGIHYCATCDGALYIDATVLVIGGGISALEEATFLTRYARKVIIVNRNNTFRVSGLSLNETLKNPSIEVMYNTVVESVSGDNFLDTAVLKNTITNESKSMKVDGIFVYIGMVPNSELFKNFLDLSEYGYILADEKLSTNIPGVYVAGDVRDKEIRQISTAVGDGTIAAIMSEKYISQN